MFPTYLQRQLAQIGGEGAEVPEFSLLDDGDWSRHPAFGSGDHDAKATQKD